MKGVIPFDDVENNRQQNIYLKAHLDNNLKRKDVIDVFPMIFPFTPGLGIRRSPPEDSFLRQVRSPLILDEYFSVWNPCHFRLA